MEGSLESITQSFQQLSEQEEPSYSDTMSLMIEFVENLPKDFSQLLISYDQSPNINTLVIIGNNPIMPYVARIVNRQIELERNGMKLNSVFGAVFLEASSKSNQFKGTDMEIFHKRFLLSSIIKCGLLIK